jgi:hypothetical protein
MEQIVRLLMYVRHGHLKKNSSILGASIILANPQKKSAAEMNKLIPGST